MAIGYYRRPTQSMGLSRKDDVVELAGAVARPVAQGPEQGDLSCRQRESRRRRE